MKTLTYHGGLIEAESNFRGLSWTFSPKYEDIGSRITKGWHAETAPAGEVHQATSNDVLATVHSSTKATSDCGECMGEGRLSQRALRMQAIWSWSLGESKSFREVTMAWSCRGIYIYMDICGVCAWCHSLVSPQVQRWPCGYRPSIQSRSPFDVPCHCSITQPNTCIHSLASIYSCGHSPFLMRTSSWMVWTGAASLLCSCGRCFIQSWQNGRSGCEESRIRWRQDEDNLPHWAGAVNMVLLIQPSSAAAEWAFSQAYPGRAAFSGQQQAAFKIMWRPARGFTTLIAETITLMCSSSLHNN